LQNSKVVLFLAPYKVGQAGKFRTHPHKQLKQFYLTQNKTLLPFKGKAVSAVKGYIRFLFENHTRSINHAEMPRSMPWVRTVEWTCSSTHSSPWQSRRSQWLA